jgi:hypothetical protein
MCFYEFLREHAIKLDKVCFVDLFLVRKCYLLLEKRWKRSQNAQPPQTSPMIALHPEPP